MQLLFLMLSNIFQYQQINGEILLKRKAQNIHFYRSSAIFISYNNSETIIYIEPSSVKGVYNLTLTMNVN